MRDIVIEYLDTNKPFFQILTLLFLALLKFDVLHPHCKDVGNLLRIVILWLINCTIIMKQVCFYFSPAKRKADAEHSKAIYR